jgi:hypothetical protein
MCKRKNGKNSQIEKDKRDKRRKSDRRLPEDILEHLCWFVNSHSRPALRRSYFWQPGDKNQAFFSKAMPGYGKTFARVSSYPSRKNPGGRGLGVLPGL